MSGDDPSDPDNDTAGQDILEMHKYLMNLCLQHGYSLKRWLKVLNAMLEKEVGRPLLNKLRIIHIIEADYNLILKTIFGRRLLWNCNNSNLLHKNHWGGWPGRSTQDLLLQKELSYDIAMRALINTIEIENDAKACYDRLIPGLVMLLYRARGVPKNA